MWYHAELFVKKLDFRGGIAYIPPPIRESQSVVYQIKLPPDSCEISIFEGDHAMNIKPLGDRVVIKPAPAEEKTKGGIILPDTAKEKPVVGEILAVGPGRRTDEGKLIPLDIKVGDKVLYGKYSGTEVALNGNEVLIMREADIFGIV